MIAVDRAYVPVATGGMNSTLRDAARFGMLVRDRGAFNGEQVIPASWVDATLELDVRLRANMAANPKYSDDPWIAYHNMWWVLDDKTGEIMVRVLTRSDKVLFHASVVMVGGHMGEMYTPFLETHPSTELPFLLSVGQVILTSDWLKQLLLVSDWSGS